MKAKPPISRAIGRAGLLASTAIAIGAILASCGTPFHAELYAAASAKIVGFSVTYAGNGATSGTAPVDSAIYRAGSSATILGSGSLARAGYVMSAWNTASDGTGTVYAPGSTLPIASANVTLYATWLGNSYDLSFDPNGGAGAMDAQSLVCGATASLSPNAFSRSGYIFSGWNTAAAGTGTGYADQASYAMGASDAKLYAQWMAATNAVTFNANGGSGSVSALTAATGQTLTLPSAAGFSLAGHDFTGWNTAADGSGSSYAIGASYAMGASSAILYAQWNAISYTITFDSNDTPRSTATQTLPSGATANLNANGFTRVGYSFAGWNTASDGSGSSYSDGASYTMGVSSVTLYAQWSALSYTVTFDSNYAPHATASQTIAFGTTTTLDTNAFTRVGYSFTGWNTASDGSGSSFSDGASYAMGASSVTLYAQWSAISYTVTFDSNDTPHTTATQDLLFGATASLSANAFTRAGYSFAGWNTAAGGSGSSYANGASYTMGASNVTLYAQWSALSYTITFDSNDTPHTTATQTLLFGATASLSANAFTRAGYSFTGWNTAAGGSGSSYANGASYTMGAADFTLYAQWAPIVYTLSYSENGAAGAPAVPVDGTAYSPGQTAVVMDNTGYSATNAVFVGWNTQAGGSGTGYSAADNITINANTTLYAMWATVSDGTLTSLPAGVTKITVPAGVTAIAATAFQYNATITSVTLPSSVTSIPADAFLSCTALQSVVMPGVLTLGYGCFENCTSLVPTADSVPNATILPSGCFESDTSITSFTIPASCAEIVQAFMYATNLLSVTFMQTTPPSGYQAFIHCSASLVIHVPSSALADYQAMASDYSVDASQFVSP